MPLPQVLAGPIVRRVVAGEVSVWIALRDTALLELKVWAGPQRSSGAGTVEGDVPLVATGSAVTRTFGDNLHVAVVTAKPDDVGGRIAPGTVHSYDLVVGGLGLRDLGLLADEPVPELPEGEDRVTPPRLALGYELDRLPTFCTPAATLADVVIAQGSCRRTNAGGPDAMAYLDDVIAEHRLDITKRPQQLFLTGDQIYADDLAGCLLPQLNALGTELLGFTETLPITGVDTDVTIAEFPVMRRRHLVREIGRFSTSDGKHHLLSYGEFLAMHLLVWGPALWRPLTPAGEVFVSSTKVAANHLQDWEAEYGTTKKWRDSLEDNGEAAYLREVAVAKVFRAAVPKVARALANTATYMIYDDHEVTDDWYMTASWRSKVLTAPFGRAVVRNAYAAYAVCQAWGNDPAAFSHEGSAAKSKNEEMLDTLVHVGTTKAFTPTEHNTLDQLLGLTAPLADPEVVFDYTVPGPRHMVRVLDTRSRRTYVGRLGPPKLLGNSMDRQLPPGPLGDGRELLVVVSPVPVLMPHVFDALIQPLAAGIIDFKWNMARKAEAGFDGPPITGAERFDVEGWGGDEDTLHALIGRLATYPQVVVLSGDVHFSSGVALDFWKGQAPVVASRIVQLTCSPLRNSAAAKIRAAIRAAGFSQQLLRGVPIERLGWNDTAAIAVPDDAPISPARRGRLKRKPATVPAGGWPPGTTIPADKPPDVRWRAQGLRDDRARNQLNNPDKMPPPLPAFNAAEPLRTYNEIAARHAEVALGGREWLRLMVFRSNLGIVRFEPDGDGHAVIHEMLSPDGPDSTTGGAFTQHRASLRRTAELVAPILGVNGDD